MNDDWIDRALRELGDHLLDREVPERLRRVLQQRARPGECKESDER